MIGGGHNDLLVVGLLAAGALLALRGKHAAGIGLVTLAMAVKASAGLALPFLVLVWAAHMTGSRWVRIAKAAAAGIAVFVVVFGACTLLAGVNLGWLPALSAPSMIVNWMSIPTAIGQIVGWFASLFGGSQQLFVNIFRGIGAAVLLWIAVRQWWAARDGGPDAIRRAGIVLLATSFLSPATLPWYVSWGMAFLAMAPWTVRGLQYLVVVSTMLVIVYYPNGEDALYNWGYLAACLAVAVLAAWSLVRPDPLRLAAGARHKVDPASRPPRTSPWRRPPSSPAPGGRRAARGLRPVSGAELDAAGIAEPALRAAYATCRALNARHGRTYFLATRLLPRARRPAVHALYGFARYADEIVDDLGDGRSPAAKAARIDALTDQLATALDGGPAPHPGAGRARRHRPPLRHRPRPLRRLPQVDAHGHRGHRLRDVRRARPLRARLRRRHRAPDAADTGDDRPAGRRRARRGGARRGVPAHQLPPRRRRGPRPRPRLPARRRARRVRRRPRAADVVAAHPPARPAHQPRARAPRGAHPRDLPPRRARGSRCSSRSRGPASPARSRSTAGSSTRSNAPATPCCTGGSRCRPGGGRRRRARAGHGLVSGKGP